MDEACKNRREWLAYLAALCLCVSTASLACAATTTAATARTRTRTRITVTPVDATAVKLSAAFSPLALGKRTTLEFGFRFVVASGMVPPPLTGIELHYPSNLGLGLSGLGLASCDVSTLEAKGPGGCSPNAVMGFGEVFTGVVFGTETVREMAPITIVRAPDQEGRLAVLFYAEGTTPVDARIIFPGLLLASTAPFGGVVNIGVPLVETLPGAPYVSVMRLRSTIGPKKVVYYEQVSGRTLAYQPLGILLPKRCPRKGFPFAARFSFTDGSRLSAHTSVPCSKRGPRLH